MTIPLSSVSITDVLVKSSMVAFSVIPAKAGIQYFQLDIDSGFRRNDGA